MKALILAAGLGTRLRPITDTVPKCMVPVNGKPIIDQQIESLQKNGIVEITVIAGYLGKQLADYLNSKYSSINIIINEVYDTTNNMYSTNLAKQELNEQDFILLNGDVFFESDIIRRLLDTKSSNAIVVDTRCFMEESMKVVLENSLIKISKAITEKEAYGVSTDIYKFSAKASSSFFNIISDYIDVKKDYKQWTEVALNDLLKTEPFFPCDIAHNWVEIDNFDDLATANNIFK